MVNFPKERLISLKKEYEKIFKYYNPFKIFKKKFLNLDKMKNLFTYKFNNYNIDDYLNNNKKVLDFKQELLSYTKNNLTTENLAKYVLSNLN